MGAILNDQNGDNQAQMTVKLEVSCADSPSDEGCDSILQDITNAVLGAVPEVGGLIAGAFDVACDSG